jgi:hypothetical protein
MSVLVRKIEINHNEFEVFGRAPWITIPVEATDKTPECVIIIEASLLSYVFKGYVSPHKYNALSRKGKNGVNLPVAFVGEDGKARAREICMHINDKLDK